MELTEILQKVLGSYIENHKSFIKTIGKHEAITMRVVCDKLSITGMTPGLIESYLVGDGDDGYLEKSAIGNWNQYVVSKKGMKFWAEGGYLKHIKVAEEEENIKQLDKTIKIKTLDKFKYDRAGFWLSCGSILITVIFNLVNYTANQSTKSEQQELKVQLNTLSTEVLSQKTTLDSLERKLIQVDLGLHPTTLKFDSLSFSK